MSLGIPYMGSKRVIAKELVDFILQANPNAKYFYDFCGGGGAMSFEALKRNRFEKVFYNELNTGVTELLRKIQADGVTDEFYRWISREEFHKRKNENSWHGGLIKTCWSFGNDQRSYLFRENIEDTKRLLHEMIVNRCSISKIEFKRLTRLYIDDYYLQSENMNNRRLAVLKLVESSLGRIRLEQLERLQHLEQLQHLAQLQRLQISNMSYTDVIITTPIDETIIYVDPPYKNTQKYAEIICHDELINYVKNSPYKIYVSSYESDLPMVWQKYKRCTLSASHNNLVTEKLFCNREQNTISSLF